MARVVNYSNQYPSPPSGLQNVDWQKQPTAPDVQITNIVGVIPGPYTVTAPGHGLSAGDIAFVQGGGFSAASGTWIVAGVAGDDFDVPGWPDGATVFREGEANIVSKATKFSAYMVPMVGATGASPPDGKSGAVPQPQPGDVSPVLKYLDASGSWSVPGGSGGGTVLGADVSFTAVTSVTINHNLGTRRVTVKVWDLRVSPPISTTPETETIVDANNIALTFGAATTGFAVVMGIV